MVSTHSQARLPRPGNEQAVSSPQLSVLVHESTHLESPLGQDEKLPHTPLPTMLGLEQTQLVGKIPCWGACEAILASKEAWVCGHALW